MRRCARWMRRAPTESSWKPCRRTSPGLPPPTGSRALRSADGDVLREQPVDFLETLAVERPCGLLQAQDVQQVVVTAARVVRLRLEQALTRLQDVDRSARANLVTRFRCLQCRLGRFDRLLQRLHACNLRIHAEVGVAGRALRRARRALEAFARRRVPVLRLAHARRREAAGEDRHGDLQAVDGVVAVAGRVARRRTALETFGFVVAAPHDEVHGRDVAATLDVDVRTRDLGREAARVQAGILFHRELDPVLGILGIRALERHVVTRLFQHVPGVAGELAQQLARIREVAFALDQRGGRGVERGLGVLHVGHGDQAHFEALLGLLELATDCVVRGLRGLERVLCREHVEVRLGRAQDQVLLGDDVVGLGLRALGIRAPERGPVFPTEHALAQPQAPVRTVTVEVAPLGFGRLSGQREAAGAVGVDGVIPGPVCIDLGQQCGEGLRLRLARGKAVGFSLAYQRVARQRARVNLFQVGGRGVEGGEACGREDRADQESGVHAQAFLRKVKRENYCITSVYHQLTQAQEARYCHRYRKNPENLRQNALKGGRNLAPRPFQNWKRDGATAWTRGSMRVSNRASLSQLSSPVRVTSRASMARVVPMTTNMRPPTTSARSRRRSGAGSAPVTATTSYAASNSRASASAVSTATREMPRSLIARAAPAARSAWISMLSTEPVRCARQAARKPLPVPISSTRSPRTGASACRMRPSRAGASMCCPWPMGICASANATPRYASGTKRSRGTAPSASSTRGFRTDQVLTC